jgi:hypothetical protein
MNIDIIKNETFNILAVRYHYFFFLSIRSDNALLSIDIIKMKRLVFQPYIDISSFLQFLTKEALLCILLLKLTPNEKIHIGQLK